MPKTTSKPKRALANAIEECTNPPESLKAHQSMAKLVKAEGNNLYTIVLPSTVKLETPSDSHLVELSPALRSTVYLRRNGYVLIDMDRDLLGGRENKIIGIIIGVVLGGKAEKEWRAMGYWPAEFTKAKAWDESDDDEDKGPQMPESDDDDDD